MNKYSLQVELSNARAAEAAAAEACPHWDYEGFGSCFHCCRSYSSARERSANARRAVRDSEKGYSTK